MGNVMFTLVQILCGVCALASFGEGLKETKFERIINYMLSFIFVVFIVYVEVHYK